MNTRIAISLPEKLNEKIEKERKESKLSRSEFIREAIVSFLGLDTNIDKKIEAKYGPIYESLKDEDEALSEEMMSIASKTIE